MIRFHNLPQHFILKARPKCDGEVEIVVPTGACGNVTCKSAIYIYINNSIQMVLPILVYYSFSFLTNGVGEEAVVTVIACPMLCNRLKRSCDTLKGNLIGEESKAVSLHIMSCHLGHIIKGTRTQDGIYSKCITHEYFIPMIEL